MAGEGEGVDEETSGARVDADPVASEHVATHAKDTEGSRNACLTAISAGDDCQQLVLEVVWKRNTPFGERVESPEVSGGTTGETVANCVAGEAVVGAQLAGEGLGVGEVSERTGRVAETIVGHKETTETGQTGLRGETLGASVVALKSCLEEGFVVTLNGDAACGLFFELSEVIDVAGDAGSVDFAGVAVVGAMLADFGLLCEVVARGAGVDACLVDHKEAVGAGEANRGRLTGQAGSGTLIAN